MNNVQIRARNVRIGSVSSLRDCKLFSRTGQYKRGLQYDRQRANSN